MSQNSKPILQLKNAKKGRKLRFFDASFSNFSNFLQKSTQKLTKRSLSNRNSILQKFKVQKLTFTNNTAHFSSFLPPKTEHRSNNIKSQINYKANKLLYTPRNHIKNRTSTGFFKNDKMNNQFPMTGQGSGIYFKMQRETRQRKKNVTSFVQNNQIDQGQGIQNAHDMKLNLQLNFNQENNGKQDQQQQYEYIDSRHLKAKVEASALQKFKQLYRKQQTNRSHNNTKRIQQQQSKRLLYLLQSTSRKNRENNGIGLGGQLSNINGNMIKGGKNVIEKRKEIMGRQSNKQIGAGGGKEVLKVMENQEKYERGRDKEEMGMDRHQKYKTQKSINQYNNNSYNINIIDNKNNKTISNNGDDNDNFPINPKKTTLQPSITKQITRPLIQKVNKQKQKQKKDEQNLLSLQLINNTVEFLLVGQELKSKIQKKKQSYSEKDGKIKKDDQNQDKIKNQNENQDEYMEKDKNEKMRSSFSGKKNSFQPAFDLAVFDLPLLNTVQKVQQPTTFQKSSKYSQNSNPNNLNNNNNSIQISKKPIQIVKNNQNDRNDKKQEKKIKSSRQQKSPTPNNNNMNNNNLLHKRNDDDDIYDDLQEVVLEVVNNKKQNNIQSQNKDKDKNKISQTNNDKTPNPLPSASGKSITSIALNVKEDKDNKNVNINNKQGRQQNREQKQKQKAIINNNTINQQQTQVSQPKLQFNPIQFKNRQQSQTQSKVHFDNDDDDSYEQQQQQGQSQKQNQQEDNDDNDDYQNSPVEELFYYIGIVQTLGGYYTNSKSFYSNADSSMVEIVMNHRLAAYYISNQFYFYENIFLTKLSTEIKSKFYTLTENELRQAIQDEEMKQSLIELRKSYEMTPKLIRQTFQKCKIYLKKDEKQLLINVAVNYHQKCVYYLRQQYLELQKIYVKNNKTLKTIEERLCFIIEIYGILMTLKGEEFKQFEELEEIVDYGQHVQKYRRYIVL